MIINNKEYNDHTYIMGILNATPDSFSDGGRYNTLDSALFRAEEIVKQGGDIIDIGGESTRPGYSVVPSEEEIDRVIPVIEAVTARFGLPVSVDTYKSEVAEAALRAGASMVNDVHGFRLDNRIAEVTAKYDAACCLMHNGVCAENEELAAKITADLQASIDIAKAAGVDSRKICIDPGVGFGKTYEQNLRIIKELDKFLETGFPVLLGVSRKSVIGLTLELPVDERLEGTIAVSVIGAMKGCRFLRVHDVQANKRAVTMTEAILRS